MRSNSTKGYRLGSGLLALITIFAANHQSPAAVVEVSLVTNDIVYDPFSKRIYATVPNSAGARANSVTPIDPATGALGTSVPVGSEPNKLAVTDNGQYLYFGLDSASSVRRFDIATQTAGLQFLLGNNSFGANYAEDIETMPGSASTVAVSRRNSCCSPRHEGVAIYVDGIQLPTTTPGHTGSNAIEFSESSATLYGYNNETTDFGFRTMAVNASGVSTTNSTGNLISGFGTDFEFGGGRIYSTTGKVIDPVSRTLLGTIAASGNVLPDPASGQVYFLSSNKIQAFDKDTLLFKWDLTVPGVSGTPGRLIRFGSNGLAFRTTRSEVFLVTDPRIGVPEPSALCLVICGLLLPAICSSARRRRVAGESI